MAKEMKNFNWDKTGNRRRSKYPWDEWLDNKTYRAVRGTDYSCQTASFLSTLRWKASSRQLKVRTTQTEEGIDGVIFQFYTEEADG